MKLLQVGPNIEDKNTIGGIITVVLVIKKVFPDAAYFSRSGVKGKSLVASLSDFISILNNFRETLNSNAFDLMHIHSALQKTAIIRDILFARYTKRAGIRILLHMHDGRFFIEEPRGVIRFLSKVLLNYADTIVVLGEKEKNFLKRVFNKDNVVILQNSLNVSEIPEPKARFSKEPFRLIFLGRIDEIKGLEEILIALTSLKNSGYKFLFTLYGSGPLLESYEPRAKSQLGDSFRYAGVVNGSAKWEALNDADIFLLPSRFEGLPMALLEAMSIELLCITSPVGCITEVVTNGVNGIITTPGDPNELSGNIRKVLDNPESYNEMRYLARRDVFEKYNETAYKENLQQIYNQLI